MVFGLDTRRPGNFALAVKEAGFKVLDELALCRQASPVEVARDISRLRKRLDDADLIHCRFAHDHAVVLGAMLRFPQRPALVRTAETARAVRPGWTRGLAFRACQAVIVPCAEYGQRLQGYHGVSGTRVHVLRGRGDPGRFSPGDGTRLRNELGVKQNEVLFGVVARIKPERLHDVLVRAFAKVALELPKARLLVVGRGEHEPALKELTRVLGLEGRVLFGGYKTGADLVAAYRALDVGVWLAEGNDGTCRGVLEAMACGVPMIVGDEGAMKEIVRDGVDGKVVTPRVDEVAQAIKQLTDPNLLRHMPKAARERVFEFTAEKRRAGLLEIYKGALRDQGR